MESKEYKFVPRIRLQNLVVAAALVASGAVGVRGLPVLPAAMLAARAHSPERTEGAGKVVAKLEPPQPVALDRPSMTITLPLPEQAQTAITQAISAKNGRVLLRVMGIDYKQNPGAGYEIYLNLPAGAAGNRDSVYYAGVLHFYTLKEAAQASGQPAEMSFDVTEPVRQLERLRQWSSQELRITFVRRGVRPPAGQEEQPPAPEAVPRFSAIELVVE